MVVPEEEVKIRVCVDFRDLNQTNPKDNFPLSLLDMLVDNATRNPIYSFMDRFSGYYKIKWRKRIRRRNLCNNMGSLLLQGHVI
jgi:hypothetical protein